MPQFTESIVEQAALAWLESTGWRVRNGAEIAPGEPAAKGDDYGQVALAQRLPGITPYDQPPPEVAISRSAIQRLAGH